MQSYFIIILYDLNLILLYLFYDKNEKFQNDFLMTGTAKNAIILLGPRQVGKSDPDSGFGEKFTSSKT